MGRKSGQMQTILMNISELIPDGHLQKTIDNLVSFDFIYNKFLPYYSTNGRPSVDPVCMFKMPLVGCLYGIKSERRLVQEVQLNLAYRWFCGFELCEKIPDHSTFSKLRQRKWNQSNLFYEVFVEIIHLCIDKKLVNGEEMVADGSFIRAEVSKNSRIDMEYEVEQSMRSYLDVLDEELSEQPGFKKPPARIVKTK